MSNLFQETSCQNVQCSTFHVYATPTYTQYAHSFYLSSRLRHNFSLSSHNHYFLLAMGFGRSLSGLIVSVSTQLYSLSSSQILLRHHALHSSLCSKGMEFKSGMYSKLRVFFCSFLTCTQSFKNTMIFEISYHKVNHFEKAIFLILFYFF